MTNSPKLLSMVTDVMCLTLPTLTRKEELDDWEEYGELHWRRKRNRLREMEGDGSKVYLPLDTYVYFLLSTTPNVFQLPVMYYSFLSLLQ
jgi:hypothetical protein